MNASAPRAIELPSPAKDSACSLHEALARRHTVREILARPLTLAQLSDLLWAASNSQEIDLYVALESGVYLYEAVRHRLAPVTAADLPSGVNLTDAVKVTLAALGYTPQDYGHLDALYIGQQVASLGCESRTSQPLLDAYRARRRLLDG